MLGLDQFYVSLLDHFWVGEYSNRITKLYDEGVVAMERLGRSTQVALTDNAVDVIRRIQSIGIHSDQIPVPALEIPG